MKNLIFLGMIGSNTKSIAESVANTLGRRFVDTDEVLTRNTGISLHEMYTLLPMNAFDDLTSRLAQQLSQGNEYIIAVGDSILKNPDAVSILKSTAYTVYIEQDIDSIAENCTDSSHPLLARGLSRLYELYNERKELFANYSDIVIPEESNAAELAISAYNASLENEPSNTADPAIKAFFKYYIESICPEADKDSFANECAEFVNITLKKYISEVNNNEH